MMLGAMALVRDHQFRARRAQEGQPPEQQDAGASRARATLSDRGGNPALFRQARGVALVVVVALVDAHHRLNCRLHRALLLVIANRWRRIIAHGGFA